MIRLIASDIDGTLLPEGTTQIPERLFTLIKELKKKGIYFAAASGRGYASVSSLFAPVLNDIIVLVENGGYAMMDGKDLFQLSLPDEVVDELIDFTRMDDTLRFSMIAGPYMQYTECEDEEFKRKLEQGYGVHYEKVKDLKNIPDKAILKCAMYASGDAADHARKVQKLFGDRASIAASGAHWVDVNPLGADKGTGLRNLQKMLGISHEETMAFGDNLNDITLLEAAYYSYAVEEARPETKEAARFSAGSLYDNGVIRVIEDLLSSL